MKKQKWQLRTKEKSEAKENEATKQKSQLPIEEASDSAKPVSVVFTFDKLLKFLKMLYNNIWVWSSLLVKCTKKNWGFIELYSKYKIVIFIIFFSSPLLSVMYFEWINLSLLADVWKYLGTITVCWKIINYVLILF